MLLQNVRHGHTFTNDCSIITSSVSKAIRCCHWIGDACIRFVARQSHTLALVAWRCLAYLAAIEQLRVDAVLLLQSNIGVQGFRALLIRHDDHASCDEATISTDKLIEVLEDVKTLFCHTNSEIIGVMLPDDGSRVTCCTAANGPSLQ